jgi:hypothetical protein
MFGKTRRVGIVTGIGVALVLGVAAVGGIAMAQTGGGTSATPTPSAGPRSGQRHAQVNGFLDALSKNLGVDRAKLDSALKTTADQQIDAAVASGQLTQDRATKLKQAVDSGQFPGGLAGLAGIAGGPGRGGRAAGMAAGLRACGQAAMTAVQQALGNETPDQLRAELQAGKTFDQIAQEHGTTAQAIGSSVAAAVKPCLDTAVQSGALTSSQETTIVNGIQSGKFPGIFGHVGGRGRPGKANPAQQH